MTYIISPTFSNTFYCWKPFLITLLIIMTLTIKQNGSKLTYDGMNNGYHASVYYLQHSKRFAHTLQSNKID